MIGDRVLITAKRIRQAYYARKNKKYIDSNAVMERLRYGSRMWTDRKGVDEEFWRGYVTGVADVLVLD